MILARPVVLAAVLGVMLSVPALAASATPSSSGTTPATSKTTQGASSTPSPSGNATGKTTPAERALLQSPQLWATIDVCTPSDQPDTIGVRGSMPGDEHSKDEMYMRFRLQYLDSSSEQWVDLANGADSGFVAVGSAKAARQTGRSFQLVPVAGKPAITMRGVVSFQWRHGSTVEYTVSRPTTSGHQSLAGADPKGFSSAECLLG
jgi:hypothetical protein